MDNTALSLKILGCFFGCIVLLGFLGYLYENHKETTLGKKGIKLFSKLCEGFGYVIVWGVIVGIGFAGFTFVKSSFHKDSPSPSYCPECEEESPDYDYSDDSTDSIGPGADNNSGPGYHNVDGYYRSDGTYVQPYIRSNPDGNPYNNINK